MHHNDYIYTNSGVLRNVRKQHVAPCLINEPFFKLQFNPKKNLLCKIKRVKYFSMVELPEKNLLTLKKNLNILNVRNMLKNKMKVCLKGAFF